MIQAVSFMLLALALGFRHSYDPDHLIAVSNILRKAKSAGSSVRVGAFWAAGHMLTATAVTLILFVFGKSLLQDYFSYFEILAGAILIVLGIFTLKDFFNFHSHRHSHGKMTHSHPHNHLKEMPFHCHKHIFGIGMLHGLASNDELLILFTASLGITTIGGILLGIGLFSIGVFFGIAVFSFLFSYPLIRMNGQKIFKMATLATGASGIIYGIIMVLW